MPNIHPVAALVTRNEQELPARVEAFTVRADDLVDLGAVLEAVDDDKAAADAADVAKMCRECRREIETLRDALVRPVNQWTKQVNGILKAGLQGKLEKEEKRLKGMVLGYQLEQERIAREARDAAAVAFVHDEAHPMPMVEEALESAVVRATPAGGYGRIGQQTSWTWKVNDLSKVPIEYFQIDEKQLSVLAKTTRPEIPGVEWVETKKAVLR